MPTRIFNKTTERIVYDHDGHGIDPGQWTTTDSIDTKTRDLMAAGKLKAATPAPSKPTKPKPKPKPAPATEPEPAPPHSPPGDDSNSTPADADQPAPSSTRKV